MWIWSEYDTDGKAWPHTCFPIMAWCKQHRILVYKAVTPSNFGHLVKVQKDAKPGSVKHRDPSCWRSFGGLLRKQKQNYAVNSCMTLPHLSLFLPAASSWPRALFDAMPLAFGGAACVEVCNESLCFLLTLVVTHGLWSTQTGFGGNTGWWVSLIYTALLVRWQDKISW